MSTHELLSTFDAHYNEKNPTEFWDSYQLSSSQNQLVWQSVKIPKGICQDATTYWKGRVIQIYGSESTLKNIARLLFQYAASFQNEFETASFQTLRTFSKWIIVCNTLCESFHHHVLQGYLRQRWEPLEKVVEKKLLKKDFVVFFPTDLVQYILSFLKSAELKELQFVSKKWRKAIQPKAWYNFFSKVRCIKGNLGTGLGYDGVSTFKGSDLYSHTPGVISGTTVIRNGNYERERSVFWNTEGERIVTAPVEYRGGIGESYVMTCFLDQKLVILFRKQQNDTMVELWENYLSETEGNCIWRVSLKKLNRDISRIHLIWSLNSKTVILNCYENHFQDRTYLYRLNVADFSIQRINGSPIIEIQHLYSHLVLCKDEAGHLHVHHFNDDGTFKNSFDLGRFDISCLYDWNLHYLAFWHSHARKALRLFPASDRYVTLDKATDINIHNPDGVSPFCAGFTNQPVFVYFSQVDDIYQIILHWMNGNGTQKIPLEKDETLIELCYISDKLFLTCSQVGEENSIRINIWNFIECTLQKSFRVIKDTPSNFIQISRLRTGLMGVLVSQNLYFLDFNEELNRFSLISFPIRVNQINFRQGVLIINPLKGNPVIASINS